VSGPDFTGVRIPRLTRHGGATPGTVPRRRSVRPRAPLPRQRSDDLALVETLAGCGRVRSFFGHLYRHVLGAGHFRDWHVDVTGDRLVGMIINLSAAPYDGGRFAIRQIGSERPLASIANDGAGDALLFRLGDTLDCRVTALEKTLTKMAFAGWFPRERDYLDEPRRGAAAGRA
jgi:hypothetical protein